MSKDSKSTVGYIHKSGTEYGCGDCILYLDKPKQCMLMGTENILVNDGCNDWAKGTPSLLGKSPLFIFSKNEVGWARSDYGFSCKRCEHFNVDNWDCEEVDKDSPGPDPHLIHPDACCNEWSPDPVRGNMPTDVVRQLVGDAALIIGVSIENRTSEA